MRLFDFNRTRQGTLIDYVSKTAGTATNIDFEPSPKGIVAEYNAALTSRFDAGAKTGFTGDITCEAWVNPFSFGQAGGGRIIDDGQLNFGVISTNSRFWIRSDGATIVYSANDSVKLRHWHHLLITRTAAGIVNFYVNGILSGTTDQDSGTPAQGTTNLFVGDNNAGTANFHGYIGKVIIHSGIFTAKQRANSMREFTIADEILENNYPEYQKPSDLSRLQNDGLVAAYNMIADNETLTDISGNGNNGTLVGFPAQTSEGLRFDGVDDFVNCGNFNDNPSEVTLVARFRPETHTNHGCPVIVKKQNYNPGAAGYGLFYRHSTSTIYFVVSGAVNQLITTCAVQDNISYNVVCTYDGTTAILYVNGVLEDSDNSVVPGSITNAESISIGSDDGGLSSISYRGQIADAKIYNYAFSEAEAIAYHNKFARQVYFKTEFLSLGVNTEF